MLIKSSKQPFLLTKSKYLCSINENQYVNSKKMKVNWNVTVLQILLSKYDLQ